MKKQIGRNHNQQSELSWRRVVVRKWLNIATANSDYSADTESDSDAEEPEPSDCPRYSRFRNEAQVDADASYPRIRRPKSVTFRAQYIDTKEIRVCAATWNVGGRAPPQDIDLNGWLDIDDPADIYVIGIQEIIPLNAGNIFGAEDNSPVSKWENIIRETLNQVPSMNKFKSHSEPPSPSKFKPSEDDPNFKDEVVLESYSDADEGIYPLEEESNFFEEIKDVRVEEGNVNLCAGADKTNPVVQKFKRQFSSPKMLGKLTRTLSGTERIGLSWPEPPLHLLVHRGFDSLKSSKSFKSFNRYSSFKSNAVAENRMRSELASLAELDLESLINRKRKPPFVRIVSKQMVGIFITVWVRRSLRRHIQNMNVSTVGVGVMGYIGNKGSISVSMSVHQTHFCFVCTHLTSGEKELDAVKRNADVQEIHKRTRFNSLAAMGFPRNIYDHERIIWLGDLNYRINLPYDRARELISKKDWSMLHEWDQLIREFKKGGAFDGWCEGTLNFAPTYKYEIDSDTYYGEDPKVGRRTPAWCDRILSFGAGMKLVRYRRSELKLSDHRPVTATYVVDVEVFSPRKLQRALTFTDAEIEDQGIEAEVGMGLLRLEEVSSFK